MDMRIEHQVVSLDEVMRYFAKGFELRDGRKIFQLDHFIDTAKGQVVFRLVTHDGVSDGTT